MSNQSTQPRAWVPVVLLALSATIGAGTAVTLYNVLAESGPTTGVRLDGAVAGLAFAAAPLLVAGILAAIAFGVGRRQRWVKTFAVAVVALGLAGAFGAGAQAAVAKYDGLPKVPQCGVADAGQSGARVAGEAFARFGHPAPFGAGWTSVEGCGANLLNVSYVEAAAYYRAELPRAGWAITRDGDTEMTANYDDLMFVLTARCGVVAVAIKQTTTTTADPRC